MSIKNAIYLCRLFYTDDDPDKIIQIRFKLHKYMGSSNCPPTSLQCKRILGAQKLVHVRIVDFMTEKDWRE